MTSLVFTSEVRSDGVVQRDFASDDVPGVLWAPSTRPDCVRLILVAHGGGQHKLVPGVVGRARYFVEQHGFYVVALDAPGHGDRPALDDEGLQLITALRRAQELSLPIAPVIAQLHAYLAALAVPEWQATVDALLADPEIGSTAPVGFWGIMQGTGIGVPLVAADRRIAAAVFGCLGHEGLTESAAQITAPIEFLLQWDDELVDRESGFALFDAFASSEKSLHVNSGGHSQVPRFEIDSAARFLTRHLGVASK